MALDWCFLQHEKCYSRAIVRFSNNYSFYLNEVFVILGAKYVGGFCNILFHRGRLS